MFWPRGSTTIRTLASSPSSTKALAATASSTRAAGPAALSRLDRDVLSQSGVRYVIVLESINDIGRLARLQAPWDEITAQQLEMGLKQIADAAHEHGIMAIGATLTPYGGAAYYSDKGEQVREAVNDWIRNSGAFDGVVDFDKATQDPQNPTHFNPDL